MLCFIFPITLWIGLGFQALIELHLQISCYLSGVLILETTLIKCHIFDIIDVLYYSNEFYIGNTCYLQG